MKREDLIRQIDANMLKRDRLAQQMADVKERLIDILHRASDEMDDAEKRELIDLLYWEWNCQVPAKVIGEMIGVNVNELARMVNPIDTEVRCTNCGRVFTKAVQTRTEYQKVQPSARHAMCLCPECRHAWDTRHERAEAEWEQRRRARETELCAMRSMPYAEYLQTDHWRSTRAKALRRADYACQICGSKEHLHVHHRTYVRRGEELPKDLIVLCESCHALYHEGGRMPNGE